MQIHLDARVLFLLFCIGQGLTTAAYLLLARPRRAGATWLGLLMLGLTLQVTDYFLASARVYFRHRWLYFMPLFYSWGFGPLLYGGVRAYYGQPLRRWWPHFVPLAAQVLFYLVVAGQDFDTKTWVWLHLHKPFTRYLEHYGAIASMVAYLGLAWRWVPATAGWRRGLSALLLFYLAAALDPLLNHRYLPAGAPKFYLTSLVLPALSYIVALLGWLKGLSAAAAPTTASTAAAATEETAAANATPAERREPPDPALLARVVQALEDGQLFRNPDLTLAGLAQQVGLTANVVSQLVNAGLGQSFTDWVNGYRLAEVERRLLTADARRFTVLALAFDAGFNSKTTFNRVFKEKTALTPSAYQKKYQSTFRDDTVSSEP